MDNTQIFVLSDIHLERLEQQKQLFLISTINTKIEKCKLLGNNPLIVFAGDVHNSIKGYDFLSQINAPIIYIAGNHEFWKRDYYETIEDLKNQAPLNVTFLHNDITFYGKYLFLGTTMWTDVGQTLNKDLLSYSSLRMNDMVYIKAKDWYDSKTNIKKLKETYSTNEFNSMVKNHNWNSLIAIEENKKSWLFLSFVNDILHSFDKVKEINSLLDKESHLSLKQKHIIEDKINFLKNDLTWNNFIINLTSFSNFFSFSKEEKFNFLKNSTEKNYFFQKLRKIPQILTKEIIILSHHLPFYEEILIGKKNDVKDLKNKLFNDNIDKNIFMIHNGVDYPEMDYLFYAQRGDIERHRDITHIVNYYNNGSLKLPKFLLDNTKIWIHGHEHNFRYIDYIKGIKIITNPIGNSLGVLEKSDNSWKINDIYKNYYQIKDSNVQEEINKIQRLLLISPGKSLSQKQIKESVKLWILKNYNWQKHIDILKRLQFVTKSILNISTTYIIGQHTKNISETENTLQNFIDAYNYNIEKIFILQKDFAISFHLRVVKNFNLELFFSNSYFTNINFYFWLMGIDNKLALLNDNSIGIYSAKKVFNFKEIINFSLKYANNTQSYFENTKFNHIYEIENTDIEKYNLYNSTIINNNYNVDLKWKYFCKTKLKQN